MKKTIRATIFIAVSIFLMSGIIDLNNLLNYANQSKPNYISKDNTPTNNPITDAGATLGRVLFYDKILSSNNSIACASCHKQEFAFSDTAQFSQGVNGQTLRHSMRLINARFGDETNFFWDERAASLENQTSTPIQDHLEMGYSGTNGDPNFQALITKLDATIYYPILFKQAFGDTIITKDKIEKALAQFVRSIQSFDSKYDAGLALANNHNTNFSNFTTDENAGKKLFTDSFNYTIEPVSIPQFGGPITATVAHRTSGGFNCASCHRPPEFDIDPQSLNNGFDRATNGSPNQNRDFTITRSPTLRDLVNGNGTLNSPMFHGGTTTDLGGGLMANYNFKEIHTSNNNLDPRLAPGGYPIYLEITNQEKNQLIAFLKTLTGVDVYTNPKWSNPFDVNGNITILGNWPTVTKNIEKKNNQFQLYPNPFTNQFTVSGKIIPSRLEVINSVGKICKTIKPSDNENTIDLSAYPAGIYFVNIIDSTSNLLEVKKVLKR